MKERIFNQCREWFAEYTAKYFNNEKDNDQSIKLKIEHSYRVCEEMDYITTSLDLNREDILTARIAALFHDIGRFEQYKRFKTYVDSKSVNHAELGAEILSDQTILNDLDSATRETLIKSVKYHNRFALPENETEDSLFYTKLVRDADKLDILEIVTDYYINIRNNGEKIAVIEYGFPESPGVSDNVRRALLNKEAVSVHDLNNLNDFCLLQLGWVYGLYFTPSLKRYVDRGYIEMIAKSMYQPCNIDDIMQTIREYIDNRLG